MCYNDSLLILPDNAVLIVAEEATSDGNGINRRAEEECVHRDYKLQP